MSGLSPRHTKDPLYRDVALPHVMVAHVLGLPVRFETNRDDVLPLVEDSFGSSSKGGRDPAAETGIYATVRLVVQKSDGKEEENLQAHFRSPRPDRLLVMTSGSVGVAEIDRREAYAYVAESLVGDKQLFQYSFLEALTLALLAGSLRGPIHAATVGMGHVGLVLAGRSGVGKSTLSYAVQRDGVCSLGEEVAFLQSEPSLGVWTVPGRIHLGPESGRFFPELAGQAIRQLPTGKQKMVIKTDRDRALDCMPVTTVGVCLLERGAGPARVEPVDRWHVERCLQADLEPGFDFYPDASRTAASQLAARSAGCWRLLLSDDPRDAVPILHDLLGCLRQRSSTTCHGANSTM